MLFGTDLLKLAALLSVALMLAQCGVPTSGGIQTTSLRISPSPTSTATLLISLSGDVMTGRGIDQILPHPGDPTLYESYATSALDYLALAEARSGPIPKPVEPGYIWGDALEEWRLRQPDVRLINLETAITTSDEYWPGKAVHYRMHPANVEVLQVAGIDVCALANNHSLDWGYAGFSETLQTLRQAGIQTAGVGQDLEQAKTPAIVEIAGKGRVIIFAFGHPSSGIPAEWAATPEKPGLHLLSDLGESTIEQIREMVASVKGPGDIVVVSIHWGSNWGYEIPSEQVTFAQQLIERAGVDLVHGHSSHHARPIQVYRGKLIIYGAGDLINDYEGIGGYEYFRSDLALLYLARVDPQTGMLGELRIVPLQIRKFRLNRVSPSDAAWLNETLNRYGEQFGTQVELQPDLSLLIR